jgi:DNA helicase-2/ATP-dependent DNA helicase PcrA
LGIGADGQLRQDKHLPAIAALLDPKQFELVSKPPAGGGAGLVVIQGSAGSGKTTVGLHRVGYLAFADGRRFAPDKMLVIVPNEALTHYVERVLPSLGVEGVTVTTFARWGARVVDMLFPKLPSRVSDETPPVVSRAKSHAAMLHGIERIVGRIERDADARVRDAMVHWPDGARVVEAWDATGKGTRDPRFAGAVAPDARVTALAQWLAGKRTLPGVAAAALPEVTRGALERLGHELRAMTRSASAVWDELLTSRAALAETFEGEPHFGPGQLDQVHDWCVRQARVRAT